MQEAFIPLHQERKLPLQLCPHASPAFSLQTFSLFFPNDYIRGPPGLCSKRNKAKETGNLELSNAKGKRAISWQQNHSCSQCSHSHIIVNSNISINWSFKVIIISPLVAVTYFFRLKAVHTLRDCLHCSAISFACVNLISYEQYFTQSSFTISLFNTDG